MNDFARLYAVLGVFAILLWALGLALSDSMEPAWGAVLGLGLGCSIFGIPWLIGSRRDRPRV